MKSLSPRETEVLKLIAVGESDKIIADKLGVSFKTADKHRQHLKKKLGIHTAVGLTHYALHHRLVHNVFAHPQ